MGQVVVTWPEIVVVGILWLIGSFTALLIGMWRIEVNTKAWQEALGLLKQKHNDEFNVENSAVVEAESAPPPATFIRAKQASTFTPADIAAALQQIRQTGGKTTLVSSNWDVNGEADGPTITVDLVDDDLDADLEDETRVDAVALVNASRMAGVWDGMEDDEENRKTIEMPVPAIPRRNPLDVLRHMDERAVEHAQVS